jgi:hypothetical protein
MIERFTGRLPDGSIPSPARSGGGQPYTAQSYQRWCEHTQEIIPFPLEDGSACLWK